jgi:hypothetical protein
MDLLPNGPCTHGSPNHGAECVECNKMCSCGCSNGEHLVAVYGGDDYCSACEDCAAFEEASC